MTDGEGRSHVCLDVEKLFSLTALQVGTHLFHSLLGLPASPGIHFMHNIPHQQQTYVLCNTNIDWQHANIYCNPSISYRN
jgi:hypothetical protein